MIIDFLKRRYNGGKQNNLYFWRDNTGNEIDLILEFGDKLLPIEIISGQTFVPEFLKGIKFWNKLTQSHGGYIVYGGEFMQERSDGIKIIPYKETDKIEI